MNVKGSIFVEVVKGIRKDKDGSYKKYLTAADRTIINETIFPSSWYPYETYKRCFNAVFEVIAHNDFNVAKEWGRASCQTVMTGVYSSVLKNCDPPSFIKRFDTSYRSFYDFGKTEVVVEGKNQALYKLSDFDREFAPLYYSIQGWIERGLELCGAKNVRSEFVTKSWESEPYTSIRFTWTWRPSLDNKYQVP